MPRKNGIWNDWSKKKGNNPESDSKCVLSRFSGRQKNGFRKSGIGFPSQRRNSSRCLLARNQPGKNGSNPSAPRERSPPGGIWKKPSRRQIAGIHSGKRREISHRDEKSSLPEGMSDSRKRTQETLFRSLRTCPGRRP